jgi:hypothetical protein
MKVVIVTEGGVIQSIIVDGDIQVLEVSYDRDEIEDVRNENPTRISHIDGDDCVLHEWTSDNLDDQSPFIIDVVEEMQRQKAAHDYLKT